MLKRLKITGFKSLQNAALDFGKVNLFIGGNGSGKTNILESIGLVAACLGRGLGDGDLAGKGIRITPSELMKSSFKNRELLQTLKLEATFSNDVTYKVELASNERDPLLSIFSESAHFLDSKKKIKNEIFDRDSKHAKVSGDNVEHKFDVHRGIWDQVKFSFDSRWSIVDIFEKFSRYIIYLPQTDFLRGRHGGNVNTPPIGLHGEGLSKAVASFIFEYNRIYNDMAKKNNPDDPSWKIINNCAKMVWFPGWASHFGAGSDDQGLSFGAHRGDQNLISRDMANATGETVYIIDKFMRDDRNMLSVYDSSEGTLFLLFAAIILSHPDAPKIFALDNVDNALNPRLTRKLVEQIVAVVDLAASANTGLGARQIFLTSHNPTALDAIDLFNEDQRIFVVKRDENGHTEVAPLKPNPKMTREDWQAVMKSRNLSEIWTDGDIPGALGPNIDGEFL